MAVAKKIAEASRHSSWIRQMFEEGARLAKVHGRDSISDFSIGNPNLEPPAEFQQVLEDLVLHPTPGEHGYMPNAGYLETRAAVAACVASDQGVAVQAEHVVMTCGSAGAVNVVFKTILDPGDEVVIPRPYFVEYASYVDNHGGVVKLVDTLADFDLDLAAIEGAIGRHTRAVIINSPNNPTGKVYPEDSIKALGELLRRRSGEIGRTIYLVSDEPYRRLVYDGTRVAPVMAHYENTIIASSYSKELSLAGERIGYAAAHPATPGIGELMTGMIMVNRTLGFVNAPALMQRVVAKLQGVTVDVSLYQRNRDVLCATLSEAGFKAQKPQGAFYLFPQSPLADDVAFCRELQQQLVLVTPGSGFGLPGHFRIAYCVPPEVVDRALPALKSIGAKYYG